MKITYAPEADSRAAYVVQSDSGASYHVRYCGSGDADPEYLAIWDCDCAAGQHGRTCKHVRAAAAIDNALDVEPAAGTTWLDGELVDK